MAPDGLTPSIALASVVVVSFISDNITMIQEQKTICKYKNAPDIETLEYSAGGHQGSSKAHQAGNQEATDPWYIEYVIEAHEHVL